MTTLERKNDSSSPSLTDALGRDAFPWQNALLDAFLRGQAPAALDLPTGLGKTSVMAIWLVARMRGAPVPRRLVYVVDRRAVVDQATTEAMRLREWVQTNSQYTELLGITNGGLPISTLRGQFVDNREWLEDPAKPAIIVGTVDMIGSRLLFEGYGASRKIRPYHAAFLACDTLFIIDEAHLIPPFQALLTSIPQNAALHAPNSSHLPDVPPAMRVLCLSATQRTQSETTFSLTSDDADHPVVKQRLEAPKHLRILPPSNNGKLTDELATEAWSIYEEKNAPLTCIVFCNGRDDATKVAELLREKAKKEKIDSVVELFVGERRIAEREEAAQRLEQLGFIAGKKKADANLPRFLVATSAAEVGVDLDADHLVCDVAPWERMVQRLGRVNRRGEGSALVRVVATPSDLLKKQLEKKSKSDDSEGTADNDASQAERYHATLNLLQQLPNIGENEFDASPSALRSLARREKDLIEKASTPAPLHPALDRATLDAWAMTSLPEHPGRPFVAPWLRGWVDDEPRVTLVWRQYIEPANKDIWSDDLRKLFVEAVPPHTSELLEAEVPRVMAWLKERVKTLVGRWKKYRDEKTESPAGLSLQSTAALVTNAAGEFVAALTLGDLITDEKTGELAQLERGTFKRNENRLVREYLPKGSLLLDARIGGLSPDGLLDEDADAAPKTADGEIEWLPKDDSGAPIVRFNIFLAGAEENTDEGNTADKNWRERLRLPWEKSADGETSEWLVIKKWRHDAATEEDRSAGREQLLSEHQAWTEERAALLGKRLALSDRGVALLKMAARLHDEGKKAKIWQRAMKAPKGDAPYAKTKGPVAPKLLNGYRHEFGSLEYVTKDTEFLRLPIEDQDLVLHIVAAHHGHARPLIGTNGVESLPPSVLKTRAQEVALRYFRLSERWGPWGLAWWESLLRAADQQASRDNDDPKKGAGR